MFGKHFESMYEGSMYGAGVAVFAVWGYVIAHVRKSRVELNPKKLSDTLGGSVAEISEAITVLLSPDPQSRHKEHEGRRLIREGEFQYFVPSWEAYQGIRNSDDRRAYNAAKQREYRAKVKALKKSKPLTGESAYIKTLERDGQTAADADFDRQQINGEALVKAMVRVETAEAGRLGRELAGDIQREQVTETVAERLTRLGQEDLARRGVVIQPKSDFERPNCDDGK